jgi:hypothetical protein
MSELRAEDLDQLREQWNAGKASGFAIPVDFVETRKEVQRRIGHLEEYEFGVGRWKRF